VAGVQEQAVHIGNYFGSGHQLLADMVHSFGKIALVGQVLFSLSFGRLC